MGKGQQRIRVHVRLEFTDQVEKSACWALNVTLRGFGLSVIDCLTSRFTRELMFVHLMDVRVSPALLIFCECDGSFTGCKADAIIG